MLPAVSPISREAPSGVSAMWCGSRSMGTRRISWWVSTSMRLTEASMELITIASGRAAAGDASRQSARRVFLMWAPSVPAFSYHAVS